MFISASPRSGLRPVASATLSISIITGTLPGYPVAARPLSWKSCSFGSAGRAPSCSLAAHRCGRYCRGLAPRTVLDLGGIWVGQSASSPTSSPPHPLQHGFSLLNQCFRQQETGPVLTLLPSGLAHLHPHQKVAAFGKGQDQLSSSHVPETISKLIFSSTLTIIAQTNLYSVACTYYLLQKYIRRFNKYFICYQ